jgi:phage terminase large subunit GpA-like protein
VRHLDFTAWDVHVLAVDRAVIPDRSPAGQWPCSACDRTYEVHDGWMVDYYHQPTRESARAYVCPRCAGLARSGQSAYSNEEAR